MTINQTSGRTMLPAFAMGLSVAASHGIGRFGYALLLPAMRESLGWSYLVASWMNTANAVGYIAGAVAGYLLLNRMRATSLFVLGLISTVASVSFTGVDRSFTWLFVMRFLAGAGTAGAFSCGSTLVTDMYAENVKLRGYAVGVFFGSAGIGMVLTALIIPALTESYGAGAWRTGWILLGMVSALLALWPLWLVRGRTRSALRTASAMKHSGRGVLAMVPAMQIAYFLFAVAHTAYAFFVFAWLRSSETDWRVSAAMWIVLGTSIFVSALVWQRPLTRWRGGTTLAATCFVVAVGSALPLLQLTTANVMISAVLVGSSIFIAPAATTVLVRQDLPPDAWPKAIMLFTTIFSVGQAFGSWSTGWLADRYSLPVSLMCGSAGLMLAAITAAIGRGWEHYSQGNLLTSGK